MPGMKRGRDGVFRQNKRSRSGGRVRPSRATMFRRAVSNTEERKYLETLVQSAPSGGAVVCINEIAEGSDFNQRIGRKVRGKYLEYDIRFQSASGVSYVYNYVCHIVLDRQANGTAGTPGQIIDQTVDTTGIYGFKNISLFQERFKILKTIEGQCNFNYQDPEHNRTRGFLPLQDLTSGKDDIYHFSSSNAAVPNTNALLVYTAADNSSPPVYVNGLFRVVYVDM